MIFNRIGTILIVLFIGPFNLLGQEKAINISPVLTQNTAKKTLKIPAGAGSPPKGPERLISPRDPDHSYWDISYKYKGTNQHAPTSRDRLDSLKEKYNSRKASQTQMSTHQSSASLSTRPVSTLDFPGNIHNGWTPPDNHIAVSDNGHIVSVINSSVAIYSENGTNSYESSLSAFLGDSGLSGHYFDPRVIYDPQEDKFIIVALNGKTSDNTTVVVGFSTTEDPNDDWYVYHFFGDPAGSGTWFDFPSIGISGTELYISGNTYTDDDTFQEALIFQIQKNSAYQGAEIQSVYYNNLYDSNESLVNAPAVISYGLDGSIGPGVFLLSSYSGGGNSVILYYTTATIPNDPELEWFEISVPSYEPAGDAFQRGTDKLLATNDSRLQSGFYADSLVHFVMNTNHHNGYSGIYYGQIDVTTWEAQVTTYGESGMDIVYPAVAVFEDEKDKSSVLICYSQSGQSIYPSFKAIACDLDRNWSRPIMLKRGETYVDYMDDDSVERWGDYSGISRRHGVESPEIWVSGSFGSIRTGNASYVLATWISKVQIGETIKAPEPDFVADKREIYSGEDVQFSDRSSNNPTNWSWTFPGGEPAGSIESSPKVTYTSPGTYDVSLIAKNGAGSRLVLKEDYIIVTEKRLKPTAKFSADKTTILAGESVQFSDQSLHAPSGFLWSFQGGTPAVSTEKNPTILYPNPGMYDVSLQAVNEAGSDRLTKNDYILVEVATGTDAPVESSIASISLFPNPVPQGNRLNIQIEVNAAANLRLQIVSGSGQIVQPFFRHRMLPGLHSIAFSTRRLMAGNYHLAVHTDDSDRIATIPFVVQ
jgi:PKD repeat protein